MHFAPRRARRSFPSSLALISSALLLFPAFSPSGQAQAALKIGSFDAATAEPPVPRPSVQPVAVPLFHDFTFTDFSPHSFSYAPPFGQSRRWAKIVLVADFFVTAGRQYDRTGEMSIGHTNVYFGTTAEPSDKAGPAWHVERDVTEDAALFKTAQAGQIQIGNTVNATYTGVIHGTASLLFYPLEKHEAPPVVPDMVLPLPLGKNGSASVSSPTDTLTETYTFPTNTVRVYLDLMTESQGSDEFWYLSVPDALSKPLQSSGGTAFREAEITVDGHPAGAAPIFPWIYTGGIDPGWWRPIPAVQTLDFAPYRVDLTPFAGVFNNGKPHKIGVRVVNNQNSFQVAGILRVYRDPKLQVVRGGLTRDTLTASPTAITSYQANAGGAPTTPVSVTSHRSFTIAGYVLTSAGKVQTRLTQTLGFSNVQSFDLPAGRTLPHLLQLSTMLSTTETQTPKFTEVRQDERRYPLAFTSTRRVNADGGAAQASAVEQGCISVQKIIRNGRVVSFRRVSDIVHPSDTRTLDAAGKPHPPRTQHSSQTYTYADLHGGFARTITADNGVLTHIQDSRLPAAKP